MTAKLNSQRMVSGLPIVSSVFYLLSFDINGSHKIDQMMQTCKQTRLGIFHTRAKCEIRMMIQV